MPVRFSSIVALSPESRGSSAVRHVDQQSVWVDDIAPDFQSVPSTTTHQYPAESVLSTTFDLGSIIAQPIIDDIAANGTNACLIIAVPTDEMSLPASAFASLSSLLSSIPRRIADVEHAQWMSAHQHQQHNGGAGGGDDDAMMMAMAAADAASSFARVCVASSSDGMPTDGATGNLADHFSSLAELPRDQAWAHWLEAHWLSTAAQGGASSSYHSGAHRIRPAMIECNVRKSSSQQAADSGRLLTVIAPLPSEELVASLLAMQSAAPKVNVISSYLSPAGGGAGGAGFPSVTQPMATFMLDYLRQYFSHPDSNNAVFLGVPDLVSAAPLERQHAKMLLGAMASFHGGVKVSHHGDNINEAYSGVTPSRSRSVSCESAQNHHQAGGGSGGGGGLLSLKLLGGGSPATSISNSEPRHNQHPLHQQYLSMQQQRRASVESVGGVSQMSQQQQQHPTNYHNENDANRAMISSNFTSSSSQQHQPQHYNDPILTVAADASATADSVYHARSNNASGSNHYISVNASGVIGRSGPTTTSSSSAAKIFGVVSGEYPSPKKQGGGVSSSSADAEVSPSSQEEEEEGDVDEEEDRAAAMRQRKQKQRATMAYDDDDDYNDDDNVDCDDGAGTTPDKLSQTLGLGAASTQRGSHSSQSESSALSAIEAVNAALAGGGAGARGRARGHLTSHNSSTSSSNIRTGRQRHQQHNNNNHHMSSSSSSTMFKDPYSTSHTQQQEDEWSISRIARFSAVEAELKSVKTERDDLSALLRKMSVRLTRAQDGLDAKTAELRIVTTRCSELEQKNSDMQQALDDILTKMKREETISARLARKHAIERLEDRCHIPHQMRSSSKSKDNKPVSPTTAQADGSIVTTNNNSSVTSSSSPRFAQVARKALAASHASTNRHSPAATHQHQHADPTNDKLRELLKKEQEENSVLRAALLSAIEDKNKNNGASNNKTRSSSSKNQRRSGGTDEDHSSCASSMFEQMTQALLRGIEILRSRYKLRTARSKSGAPSSVSSLIAHRRSTKHYEEELPATAPPEDLTVKALRKLDSAVQRLKADEPQPVSRVLASETDVVAAKSSVAAEISRLKHLDDLMLPFGALLNKSMMDAEEDEEEDATTTTTPATANSKSAGGVTTMTSSSPAASSSSSHGAGGGGQHKTKASSVFIKKPMSKLSSPTTKELHKIKPSMLAVSALSKRATQA